MVAPGAGAIMAFPAAAFAGHAGGFTDAAGVARGLQGHAGRLAGVLFAIALLDASIIGPFAVSLSTAYALGDVFGLKHSLHRWVKGARGFSAVYAARTRRASCGTPPLALLSRPPVLPPRRIGLPALRLYLAMATVLVIVKIAELAIGR